MSLLTPHSLSELQAICQAGKPLVVCGRGSKLHWLSPQALADRLLVTTTHLPEVWEHATADLVLTVSAGSTLQAIQARLTATGQFLPLMPPYPDQTTIGGIVAVGINGSLRHRYGAVRDLVLGIEFMRTDGVLAKAGGKVVKNVAGYDLMKLLTGSWGTLAIITAVTLRLYPHPPTQATLLTTGNASVIADLLGKLWRSGLTPTVVDLCTTGTPDRLTLVVQFMGLGPAVNGQVTTWQNLTASAETKLGELPVFNWQTDSGYALCRLGILPAHGIALAEQFGRHPLQIHLGSGIGFAHIPLDQLGQVQNFCQSHQGYLQLLHPPASTPPHPLMSAIKQQLDPQGILPPWETIGK
ncbi:MAG: FAD-binding oxidoreductase [Pseudanabaenaceae cyanobacterium]